MGTVVVVAAAGASLRRKCVNDIYHVRCVSVCVFGISIEVKLIDLTNVYHCLMYNNSRTVG